MGTDTNIPKCMAYLEKLPHANSGAGGHNATLQAALACRRFGLSAGEMWDAMQWFNDNRCTPRWSEAELRHKIASVAELPIKKPLGGRGIAGRGRVKTFVAPTAPERPADTRPICQRSEQEEELWWTRVALERGVTLEEWDGQE